MPEGSRWPQDQLFKGASMDKEIRPASYHKRKFQSIHDLLHSKAFMEPVAAEVAEDVAIVSLPDMTRRDDLTPVEDVANPSFSVVSPGGAAARAVDEGKSRVLSSKLDLSLAGFEEAGGDWIAQERVRNPQSQGVEGYVTDLWRSLDDVEPIVRQINRVSNGKKPAVHVFTSADRNSFSAGLAYSVAVSLACRFAKPVILVDSDFQDPLLTRLYDLERELGISDFLFHSARSSHWLYQTDRERVMFVPVGNVPFGRLLNDRCSVWDWLDGLEHCGYHVCVSAGNAHDNAVRWWCESCGGIYLSVDQKRTSQVVARSAVSQLRGLGAESLSCVVH